MTIARSVIALAIAAGAGILSTGATAQQNAAFPATCGARDAMLAYLADRYGEEPVSIGVAANGMALQILTSTDGATWSAVVAVPSGDLCLIASGEAWQPAAAPKRGGL